MFIHFKNDEIIIVRDEQLSTELFTIDQLKKIERIFYLDLQKYVICVIIKNHKKKNSIGKRDYSKNGHCNENDNKLLTCM